MSGNLQKVKKMPEMSSYVLKIYTFEGKGYNSTKKSK